MSVQVKTVVVGPIQTNCYTVTDGKGCLVIDPGDEPDAIIAALDGKSPDLIVLTHRHWDHLQALPALLEAFDVPLYIHELDADAALDVDENRCILKLSQKTDFGGTAAPLPARRLNDGDWFKVGDMRFEVLHTPGHTVGSMCLYDLADELLFAGDTLFYHSYGRTDLPTGSESDMVASLARLAALPPSTVVYPGHDRSTSIGFELQHNPLMSRL